MTKDVPEIRFNDFVGNWQLLKIEDVAQFHDERRKPITESAREPGPYPYYGASGIIDYVKDYIFDEEMILLSEDGANIIDRNYRVSFLASGQYWVNNHAHVLKAKQGNNNLFLCESLERLRYDKYNTGTAQPKINQDVCRNLPVYITDNDEQEIIGNYFQKLDTLINQHQQKHDKLSNLKKAMLEKMFPKAGENVPEIRFDGFNGDWLDSSLLENIESIIDFRGRTPKKLGLDWSPTGYRALSALNVKQGYIDFSVDPHFGDQNLYERWMTGSELHKGQVLFTTEAPMGNVAQVPDSDKYILSQRTIAFRVKSKVITEDFLAVLLRSPKVFRELSALASGGTAKGVSQKVLSKLTVQLPACLVEQSKIGNYFQKLDGLINQHQQQITKLKNIKQACLDKMFV